MSEQLSREVPYTEMVPQEQQYQTTELQYVQRPYTYQVCVMKPETRTRQFQVCRLVSEQLSREVQYTVCVPQQQEYQTTQLQYVQRPHNIQVCVMNRRLGRGSSRSAEWSANSGSVKCRIRFVCPRNSGSRSRRCSRRSKRTTFRFA